jgi:hypothetical protein
MSHLTQLCDWQAWGQSAHYHTAIQRIELVMRAPYGPVRATVETGIPSVWVAGGIAAQRPSPDGERATAARPARHTVLVPGA